MTKKLHHRFWRHLFNLYNSAQSHHSPSLNLTECFNNFTGAPEGIRTLKTSVLSRRCLPVASRTHLIGGDYGSWNPFRPFLSTAAQETSIEALPEILTSASPPLIPVHFALAGSPPWAEQVLTHFLVIEVVVPLSSHYQPRWKGCFPLNAGKFS